MRADAGVSAERKQERLSRYGRMQNNALTESGIR